MVLYKKVFSLAQDVSFFDYIAALRKKDFPDYVLTLEKIPSKENYQAQIFLVAPLWRWGVANAFLDGVLLNKCTIQKFENAEKFSLQASPRTINLFFALIYILSSVMLLFFAFFMMIKEHTLTSNNVLGLAIITILFLAPPLLVYLRDKNFLDKVGSLGKKLEKN